MRQWGLVFAGLIVCFMSIAAQATESGTGHYVSGGMATI